MISLNCKVENCGKRTEGSTGLCSSHNRALRKPIKPAIKRQSDKLAKDLKLYGEKRHKYLQAHKICEVCKINKAKEVHHKRGRGKELNNEKLFLAVCHTCHVKITIDSKFAIAKGYSLPRTTA